MCVCACAFLRGEIAEQALRRAWAGGERASARPPLSVPGGGPAGEALRGARERLELSAGPRWEAGGKLSPFPRRPRRGDGRAGGAQPLPGVCRRAALRAAERCGLTCHVTEAGAARGKPGRGVCVCVFPK